MREREKIRAHKGREIFLESERERKKEKLRKRERERLRKRKFRRDQNLGVNRLS